MLADKKYALNLILLLTGLFSQAFAVEVPIYDFPLQTYSQQVNDYLPKERNDYEVRLLSPEYQEAQVQQLIRHYYASDKHGLSPWSAALIQSLLPEVKKLEQELINRFDNQQQEPAKYHFGENFKAHDAHWLNKIINNMALDELALTYKSEQRAIITENSLARSLPDSAPDFFHFSLAGQGFPFDNLQESALWVGTPIYVLHVSKDRAWSLVATPDAYIAWIKSSDLAYASEDFIQQWQHKAKQGLAAIGNKKEGDLKTPAGLYPIDAVFGSQALAVNMDFKFITPDDKFIDDPLDPQYNSWQQGQTQAKSYELMDHPLYKLGAVIAYNMRPVIPGAGSAIFLHIWRSAQQGTAGCVALSEKNLLQVLGWLDKRQHPYILITPRF